MRAYCENESSCRRKFFYDIFNEIIPSKSSARQSDHDRSTSFTPCGNMCDVCLNQRRAPLDRKVIKPMMSSTSSSSVNYHEKNNSKHISSSQTSKREMEYSKPIMGHVPVDALKRGPSNQPKPMFQRASALLKSNQQTNSMLHSSLFGDDDEPDWIIPRRLENTNSKKFMTSTIEASSEMTSYNIIDSDDEKPLKRKRRLGDH